MTDPNWRQPATSSALNLIMVAPVLRVVRTARILWSVCLAETEFAVVRSVWFVGRTADCTEKADLSKSFLSGVLEAATKSHSINQTAATASTGEVPPLFLHQQEQIIKDAVIHFKLELQLGSEGRSVDSAATQRVVWRYVYAQLTRIALRLMQAAPFLVGSICSTHWCSGLGPTVPRGFVPFGGAASLRRIFSVGQRALGVYLSHTTPWPSPSLTLGTIHLGKP